MPNRRFSAEQIVTLFRQTEVSMAAGMRVRDHSAKPIRSSPFPFDMRLLVNLLGVGNDPVQGLFFGSEAFDAALVARVISDNDVPTGPPIVLEGQHDRLFF